VFEGTLADIRMSDALEFVTELPRTAAGRLLKTKLCGNSKDFSLPLAVGQGWPAWIVF